MIQVTNTSKSTIKSHQMIWQRIRTTDLFISMSQCLKESIHLKTHLANGIVFPMYRKRAFSGSMRTLLRMIQISCEMDISLGMRNFLLSRSFRRAPGNFSMITCWPEQFIKSSQGSFKRKQRNGTKGKATAGIEFTRWRCKFIDNFNSLLLKFLDRLNYAINCFLSLFISHEKKNERYIHRLVSTLASLRPNGNTPKRNFKQ